MRHSSRKSRRHQPNVVDKVKQCHHGQNSIPITQLECCCGETAQRGSNPAPKVSERRHRHYDRYSNREMSNLSHQRNSLPKASKVDVRPASTKITMTHHGKCIRFRFPHFLETPYISIVYSTLVFTKNNEKMSILNGRQQAKAKNAKLNAA